MTERLVDFIKTVFETGKERIKNPIVGTFLIAATAFNWKKIFIILWSDRSIEGRIGYIEENFSLNYESWLFWMPLLVTVFYVFGLPFLMRFVEVVLKRVTENRKDSKIDEIKEDLDRRIEVTKKKNDLEDAIAKYASKEELNQRIKDLKESKSKYEIEISELGTSLLEAHKLTEQLSEDFGIADAARDQLKSRIEALNIDIKNKENNLTKTKQLNLTLSRSVESQKRLICYALNVIAPDLKKWDREYEAFKLHEFFKEFPKLKRLVNKESSTINIDDKTHKYFVNQELIEYIKSAYEDKKTTVVDFDPKYTLTSKGIYFWNSYMEEQIEKSQN